MYKYLPDSNALEYAKSNEQVIYADYPDYISFYSRHITDKKCGIIFFHGANVDVKSYIVLGRKLAENGIAFVGFKMTPLFTDFRPEEAMNHIETLGNDTRWYLAGHSLGGAIASRMMAVYPDYFVGLILLASYAAGRGINLSNRKSLKVLTIWASNDEIVTKERIFLSRVKLPKDAVYHQIVGGNHAQFGSYGRQNGDLDADISEIAQIDETVRVITSFINENS